MLLQKPFFLVPPFSQPCIERLQRLQWHVSDLVAAPVKVHRRRVTFEIRRAQCKDVLSVLSFPGALLKPGARSTRPECRAVSKQNDRNEEMGYSRHPIISQRAVIDPLHRPLQRLQTEIRPGTSRNQLVLQVLIALLSRPSNARRPPVLAQVRPFGKHDQPHRIQRSILLASPRELAQSSREARFVSLHLSCHEDKAGKTEPESNERDIGD